MTGSRNSSESGRSCGFAPYSDLVPALRHTWYMDRLAPPPWRVRPLGIAADQTLAASLTPEAISEGARRLGSLGLAYVAVSILGPVARLVLRAAAGSVHASDFGIPDAFGLAGLIMGLAVFAIARRGMLPVRRLLDLGLVFQVVGALGFAVREFWYGLPQTPGGAFSIPAECVLIVIYPLIVPNTPRKVLVASMLSASMGPVGLAIAAAVAGHPAVGRPLDIAIYFLTSSYLCAILAYVTARIVHRNSLRLEAARAFGSYELIERIGTGGMGEVWRARHRLLARHSAIKLIRSNGLADGLSGREALVQRFHREARATAALRSIHTVDVYDFGLTEDGDFYYVMELLDGIGLDRFVRQFGPVAPARTAFLLRQVCHSLAEAHSCGLIHRDVKPANILVCRLGQDVDFVKVLDFGLVKHSAGSSAPTMLTRPGMVAGTPGYLAPEIALGRRDVDGRADLYSLGCVAYYLLTGQPVFSADTAVAQALAHVQNQPVPPSARSEFEIPEALEALIMECLAKDPAARPPSAEVLSQRLVAAVPADGWTDAAARRWWAQHQPIGRPRLLTVGAADDRRVRPAVVAHAVGGGLMTGF
jgi:serine/threonine-protein kinase